MNSSFKNKIISFTLASTMLMSATTFAEGFKDVEEQHWAYKYINKMNEKKIITGYNGYFKPSDKVTREQGLLMLSRLLKVSDEDKKKYVEKHEEFMKEINISDWAKEGVAIALEKGILTKDDIKNKLKGKSVSYAEKMMQESVEKAELCIYITRAVGLEDEAKKDIIINLDFKDVEMIPVKTQAYIERTVDMGVINPKGDSEGKFNPESEVSRDVMAKMMFTTDEYLQKNPLKEDEKEQEKEEIDIKDTVEFSGVVVDLNGNEEGAILKTSSGTYHVGIKNKKTEKTEIYKLIDGEVILDGKKVKPEEIADGLKIRGRITADSKIINLIAESFEETIVGMVRTYDINNPDEILIEYDVKGEKSTSLFKVKKEDKIELDGKEAFMYQLRNGDNVEIKAKNGKISELKASSKNKKYNGTLKKIKFEEEPIIVISTDDGEFEYKLSEDIKIKRNGRTIDFIDLKNGDIVEVETEYDKIERVDAYVVNDSASGTIEVVHIGPTSELSISLGEGKVKSYILSKDVKMYVNGEKTDIYELKRGYKVDIEVESNEIVRLDAEVKEAEDKYAGSIKYVNHDANLFVLKQGDDNTFRINVSKETNYIFMDGKRKAFKELKVGDEVVVKGSDDGVIFKAESIVIFE